MAKLSIVLIVVFSIVFGISSLAERVENNGAQVQEQRTEDQDEDAERFGGFRGNGGAQVRYRPVGVGSAPVNSAPSYLSCYSCTNCPTMQPNVSSKLCPFSLDAKRNKCVTYNEKYNHMKDLFTIRGCASERGTCAEIRAAHAQQGNLVKLVHCNECDGDLCNGVDRFSPSLFVATLAVLFTPLLAKNLLA